MRYRFNFENLIAWQKARVLTKEIYWITSKLPKEEIFGLGSQIRRAIVSVGSNLAEGSGRVAPKEQIHFYEYAFGSMNEVASQLFTLLDLDYVTEEQFNDLIDQCGELAKMINALVSSIKCKLK